MSDTMKWIPAEVDADVPSVARIYDYLLGGSHNFAPDRAMADKLLAVQPNVADIARRNRAFLRRVVQFMVEAGVRQFLDLGSGIPTAGNVHEIAQQAAPGSRVVYVDYEGVAVAHSKLLLAENENAAVVQADVTRPDDVLGAEETRRLIDFSQPVGLLAITIGHYLPPASDPAGVFGRYRDAVARGSYLALTHLTDDFTSLHGDEIVETMKSTQNNVFPRTREQVLELFGDFDLVEPGLVTTSRWHPDYGVAPAVDPEEDGLYAGVALKP
ncbi:SAM-dependent methyltransferase [Kutzneria kofuensis]|uniref:S-adenosyl methyltransferase n=1 Tax=Kutzneria kofuensis TaxID=103725 RepID=A0A7W9KQ22_9PSEU|nr:SAM-dependent methyltransferase [Kutzneria kofuensis]MBB5896655.1 hypothetical protein [Kutzneria kofuensis]